MKLTWYAVAGFTLIFGTGISGAALADDCAFQEKRFSEKWRRFHGRSQDGCRASMDQLVLTGGSIAFTRSGIQHPITGITLRWRSEV
jgi:hypothetical protein